MNHLYDFTNGSTNTRTYTTVCRGCKEANSILVDADMFQRWFNREILVQDAFPFLTIDQREILMTGIHPDCWDKMFG